MRLNIKYSEFKRNCESFQEELKLIAETLISEENIYNDAHESLKEIIVISSDYVEMSFSKDLGGSLSELIRSEEVIDLRRNLPLNERINLLKKRINYRIKIITYILKIVKISDPICEEKSFVKERSNFSTNEKIDFLLLKLYALRKDNLYWNTRLIFKINQVEMDNIEDTRGIANILESKGLIETIGGKDGLSAKITSEGKLFWEENYKPVNKKEIETTMDIFISHSSQDTDTAKLLIDLLKTSLNLSSSKIRCTSVNGYRLPAGATTDEVLKKEVHDSKVLIGLISPNSINSAYVLFELGARWGASLSLIPLITSELGSELLKGPLSGINALNCCEPAQLQQLVSDLKTELKITGESPEVYQDKIELLVNHSLRELLPNSNINKSPVKQNSKKLRNLKEKNGDKIKSYCEKQWPDDYSMRVHCIKEQREAKEDIDSFKPLDIPEEIFNRILEKAISEWPTDYTMQVHSRNEQIDAYLELNDM